MSYTNKGNGDFSPSDSYDCKLCDICEVALYDNILGDNLGEHNKDICGNCENQIEEFKEQAEHLKNEILNGAVDNNSNMENYESELNLANGILKDIKNIKEENDLMKIEENLQELDDEVGRLYN